MSVPAFCGTTAADPSKGMTLGELRDMVAAAYSQGYPDSTPIRIQSGFRAQIRRTWIEGTPDQYQREAQ